MRLVITVSVSRETRLRASQAVREPEKKATCSNKVTNLIPPCSVMKNLQTLKIQKVVDLTHNLCSIADTYDFDIGEYQNCNIYILYVDPHLRNHLETLSFRVVSKCGASMSRYGRPHLF